jgi:hypothetical protein
VLKVLGGAGAKDLLFGPPMTSLSEVRTDVNPRMAPRRQAQADAGDGRRGDSY